MNGKMLHKCTGNLPSGAYGSAVSECCENEDGELWVTGANEEYFSQVNFCPYCGYKAKKQVEIKNDKTQQ